MKLKKFISVFGTLCFVLLISSCSKNNNQESVKTIKLGFTHANDVSQSYQAVYANCFKEYLEKNCETLNVDLYPSSQLGATTDMVGSVISGSVEMCIGELSLLNNYDRNTMVFILPGAFTDFEEVNSLLDSDWARSLFDNTTKIAGVIPLDGMCAGMRSFTTKGYEVRTVKDMKGLTMRVMDSPMYVELVKSLSANPVPMPSSDMYIAMQNGVVDGQENPVSAIINDKTYEVQDWYVLDCHTPLIDFAMLNDEFYEGLSDEEKEVVIKASRYAISESRKFISKFTEDGLEKLEGLGMTIYRPTEEELQEWHAAYGPVCEKFMRSQIGDTIVDELLSEIKKLK